MEGRQIKYFVHMQHIYYTAQEPVDQWTSSLYLKQLSCTALPGRTWTCWCPSMWWGRWPVSSTNRATWALNSSSTYGGKKNTWKSVKRRNMTSTSLCSCLLMWGAWLTWPAITLPRILFLPHGDQLLYMSSYRVGGFLFVGCGSH